jgi:hypothetical protein
MSHAGPSPWLIAAERLVAWLLGALLAAVGHLCLQWAGVIATPVLYSGIF